MRELKFSKLKFSKYQPSVENTKLVVIIILHRIMRSIPDNIFMY